MVATRLTTSRWTWFLKGLPSLPRASAMFRIKRYTMTTPIRCRTLWDHCQQVLRTNVPGSFVECGVWKGGSAGMMALALQHSRQNRDIHLFDSFEGLPEPTTLDGAAASEYSGGRHNGNLSSIDRCKAGLSEVRHLLLDKLQTNPARLHFHVGWFQATVPQFGPTIGPIALLRLDGDWYESTRLCLDHLYPNLSPGGVIVIDDYWAWEGCRKATDEYRNTHGISTPIHRIDQDAGFWIKT